MDLIALDYQPLLDMNRKRDDKTSVKSGTIGDTHKTNRQYIHIGLMFFDVF